MLRDCDIRSSSSAASIGSEMTSLRLSPSSRRPSVKPVTDERRIMRVSASTSRRTPSCQRCRTLSACVYSCFMVPRARRSMSCLLGFAERTFSRTRGRLVRWFRVRMERSTSASAAQSTGRKKLLRSSAQIRDRPPEPRTLSTRSDGGAARAALPISRSSAIATAQTCGQTSLVLSGSNTRTGSSRRSWGSRSSSVRCDRDVHARSDAIEVGRIGCGREEDRVEIDEVLGAGLEFGGQP